jgi:cellobiose transport system permease protein
VPGPHLWEHIRTAFAQANFGLALVNSAIVCIVITLCVLLTSTLAGFAFARLRFRAGRRCWRSSSGRCSSPPSWA